MNDHPVHVGAARIQPSAGEVHGEYVRLGSERFYRIAHYDRMDPFFLSIASPSNHWLFVSSRGGLTAGRQNADHALFPYYTEDKIHDGSDHTGSRTLVRVLGQGKRFLWEPFSQACGALYDRSRSLYKNVVGNQLVFEEENHDLGLRFRYTWTVSDRFGLVKRAELANTGREPAAVELLDGIQNLLPSGIAAGFQNQYSCLGDAYKQNELESETGLGIYALSSLPGDSPEPAEALRATVVWSDVPPAATRLLSSLQLDAFRHGGEVRPERRICGRRGAYFVHQTMELAPGAERQWLIVADVEYGLPEIAALRRELDAAGDPATAVLEDVEEGTRRLAAIVARADGLQTTGDRLGAAHHFSNVLFNVMRGGIFDSAYSVPVADFRRFVASSNRQAAARQAAFLDGLGERVELGRLLEQARSLDDPELLRLAYEYLPISFSRRHGDPSRPWNQFSINVKNRDGSKVLDYQGNWRDIFQNWEALCLSFPEYLESVISRFVNTTTADGYNPYRITKEGFDWEAPDPDDPWAHFGYWGDHQIIYLLKFLELSRNHHPGGLERLLSDRRFVYADVPYDIKPYDDLLADPRASLVYNTEREGRIAARVEALGFDGRYLADPEGRICRANLTEKLLVPLLAKLSSFVPGAGFWMNTQRPEWNDANNALAGYGASMVTVCYARRYVTFLLELLRGVDLEQAELSGEVAGWLQGVHGVLADHREMLQRDAIGDRERKAFLDGVGRAAEAYRSGLYARGLGGRSEPVAVGELIAFLELARELFDQSIRANRRDDGLYHAYNILEIGPEQIQVDRLNAMLEGQVAVLSSGGLAAGEAESVLEALRRSEMYRADQHSYLLYPNRELPGFLEKNTIAPEQAEGSELLARLVADGNTDLVERDVDGALHFHGLLKNVRDLRSALERLRRAGYEELVEREGERVAEIFERVFEHQRFTGRSGTFYGYEGLGCIYWHMVSKLLLAVQEASLAAEAEGDSAFGDLARWYYDVRSGIGFNKPPEVYGAFPTDPYSHTPGYGGARQPGMTGQVKEEILTRFGELGLTVREGRVSFQPVLLRRSEFLSRPESFAYYDASGSRETVELEQGTLAFTYCQVPIVYRLSEERRVRLLHADGTSRELEGAGLDAEASRAIFTRSGKITRIEVWLAPGLEK